MPKVSVIVPIYNTDRYLSMCLDSVLDQSLKDIEVICVNDGSTDKSGEILKIYEEKDSRIKVITQKNKGLSAARNAGLDIAKGDWIAFVDSDDILPPNALTVLCGVALASKCKIVASRTRFNNKDYERLLREKAKPEYSFEHLVWNGLQDFVRDPKIFSSVWNKIFHRDLFKDMRFKEGMLFEDWPVLTILFGRVNKYATTDVACYVYREDNTSITRSSFSLKKIDSYIQGINMVYHAYKGTNKLAYARKRMTIAVKMLVNKVYRADDPKLVEPLITSLNKLFNSKIIRKGDLPIKTRWRLFFLKRFG